MNQPKPSLLEKNRHFQYADIDDEIFIPKAGVHKTEPSAPLLTFQVPSVMIQAVYRNFREIRQREFHSKSDQDYDFYISGAMTGREDHNFGMFHAYAHGLRNTGFRVFNPAENFGGDKSRTRSVYMRKDISAIMRSGNLMILPDFEGSEGVIGEVNSALAVPDIGIYMIVRSQETQTKEIIIKLR